MKKTNSPEPAECRQIKKLLLEKPLDSASETEKSLISRHLSVCQNCRQYQLLLSNMEKTLAQSAENIPIPDPEIYHSLIDRWRAVHQKPDRKMRTFIQTMKELLSYRIPVYQAVLGLVMAFILVGLFDYFPLADWQHETPSVSRQTAEPSSPGFSDVFIQLEFTTAGKFGMNMKEDTTFTRFSYSAM
jgi:hypothetical protein